MASPNKRYNFRLSVLRDIGWTYWDPIGLLAEGDDWRHEDNLAFANEYDTYLVHAARFIADEVNEEDILDYLAGIEAEHMGLGNYENARNNAQRVLEALKDRMDQWHLTS